MIRISDYNCEARKSTINYLLTLILLVGNFTLCLGTEDIIDEEFFELKIEDCNGMADLCIDVPFGQSSDYSFLVDGTPYAGTIEACGFDTIQNYGYADVLMPGPYTLDSWIVDASSFSGDFPDFPSLVDSMNIWDPTGNWQIDLVGQLIVGGDTNKQYGEMVVIQQFLNSPTILDSNEGITPNGSLFRFDVGVHEVVILEFASGCLDTFQVAVSCAQNEEVWLDMMVGDMETHCFDFSELPGFVQNVSNIHPVSANPVASYTFVNGNSCVEVEGISIGLDTACIVYCDQLNFCDTTFIYIDVNDGLMHTIDTTYVNIDVYGSSSYCFVDEFDGNAVSTMVGCEGASSDIDFSALDAMNCVDYTANGLEQDQICVIFTDDQGNTHTEYLIVTVNPPSPEIIEETVFVSNTYNDCLDVSELNGNIVNIEDICAGNSNNAVNFGTNNVSLCLVAEAVEVGVDTACIVICDDQGVCDTTTYIITVEENNQIPSLADDLLATTPNNQVSIQLCENDQLYGLDITNIEILADASNGNGPQNGFVAIDQGCSITYTPNEDYCGDDNFDYVICNVNGCDTATVAVVVDCASGSGDDLEIRNAFSPNLDGINDTFTIQGIGNYPGNVLRVYDRWGQRVHQAVDYQNDWLGTWSNGDLPDGTYFYTLSLNDGNRMSGYVQIHR